jgi:diaminopimelate epimerase
MNNIPFAKMHASGNDFILIDNRHNQLDGNLPVIVDRLCRRRFSVGADGLILVESSDVADYKWRFFNADGSEVEMCGNGSRCVARFAYMKGIAGKVHSFETIAGVIRAEVGVDTVKVQLTPPHGMQPDMKIYLPVVGEMDASFVNTGVPHVVYFVDDLEGVDVMKLGAATRYHDMFAPGGTNANFAAWTRDNELSIRTYERGVEGETLACGTGATAAALMAGLKGLVSSPVTVRTRGGNLLKVYFDNDSPGFGDVFLEGDAVLVYQGNMEPGAFL